MCRDRTELETGTFSARTGTVHAKEARAQIKLTVLCPLRAVSNDPKNYLRVHAKHVLH